MGNSASKLAAVLAVLLLPSQALADCGSSPFATGLASVASKLKSATLPTCTDPSYSSSAPAATSCKTCVATATRWKQQAQDLACSTGNNDTTTGNGFTPSTSVAGQGAAASTTSSNGAAAATGKAQQATNAQNAKSQFDLCVKDMNRDCPTSLATTDFTAATAISSACQQMSTASADQAKKSGLSAAQLMQMAGLAMQAAQLLQAMQPQQQQSEVTPASVAATDPLPSTDTGSSGPGISKLGDNSAAPVGEAMSASLGNAPQITPAATAAYGGDTGSGSSWSPSSTSLDTGSGGASSPLGSYGSMAGVGAGGTGAGGTAAVPKNEDSVAGTTGDGLPKAEGSLEIGLGSARPAIFGGGKNGKTDAPDAAGMDPGPVAGLDNRAPASDAPPEAAPEGDGEASIFSMVQSRYAEIVRSGKL